MTDLIGLSLAALLASAAITAALIVALRPLLARYALAKPNARTSHVVPTPQGAGIAVVIAVLVAAGALLGGAAGQPPPTTVFGAILVIAAVGAIDDIRSVPVLPRLLLQGLCAAAILVAARDLPPILAFLPRWVEQVLLFFAVVWFVNLVNFMDGLDLMTVVEVLPVAIGLVVMGWLDMFSQPATLVAAALAGAMLGFAPFNRPVAKVFLGDVGSLPIGLMLAWCLIEVAARQSVVAALLLPLYYIADATITLLQRVARREPVWVAHRTHFYQRATVNGFRVTQVVGRVFVLNILLAVLALAAVSTTSLTGQMVCLAVGATAVAVTMKRFASPASLSSV